LSSEADPAGLPYRPCAGIALFNREGLVWIGRRIDGPQEAEGIGQWWQMPQGGIDEGEDPVEAARRELAEETGVISVSYLGEMEWLTYDLPEELIGKAWKGRYRGQRVKWVAFSFDGGEDEIDVLDPGEGHKPEFSEWRWERLEALPELIVPFKREAYEAVAREFARFARSDG
jgi:putative (di)nucleoside polyphosphate hydrolase